MQKNIAIIGGGITGLTSAFALLQKEQTEPFTFTITLFEQDHRLGGKIQTDKQQELIMETGPDSMLTRKVNRVPLLRDLGLDKTLIGSDNGTQKTYIVHRGKLKPIPPGTNMGIPMQIAPFATTPLLSVGAKIRALGDLLIARRQDQEDTSLGHFLRRRFGNELVDHIAEPLMAGIYAGRIDDLSLQATFSQFDDLEKKYRSLILGSMAQRKAMKASTQKPSTRSAFVTVQGGLATIVDAITAQIQDRIAIRLQTTVTAIHREQDASLSVKYRDHEGDASMKFDAVIVTTPTFVTAKLLEPVSPVARELEAIVYGSTATVMTAFYKKDMPILDASGFVVPRKEKRAITACTWISSKWPHSAPPDHVLLRSYVGRSGETEILSLSDDQIIEKVRTELKALVGIEATPYFAKVTRWDRAMPQYHVHHLSLVNRVKEDLARRAPTLQLAGAGYLGLGVPDCIAQGYEAVDNILNELNKK